MEIKSGLWYASAEGRKAHFLHTCIEKRCPGPKKPAKTACFKGQQGERDRFSPCTPFHLHNFLIGSTAVSRWTRCCLQTSATCTAVCRAVKQQHASRLVWSLFTRAGWEIKHIQHGLRSDWDEKMASEPPGAWASYRERVFDRAIYKNVSFLRQICTVFLKETHLSIHKCSWQIRYVNA